MAPGIFCSFIGKLYFGFYTYAAIPTGKAARVAMDQTSAKTGTAAPTGNLPSSQNFKDPMAGKGQPPPPTPAQAPATPVSRGTLTGGSRKCHHPFPALYSRPGQSRL